jgi:hypothetical protein
VEGEATTTRLLEKLSYVSLIIAALVVSGSAVYDRAIVRSEGRAERLNETKRLGLEGVNWAAYKETIVLTLNTGCHWCSASAPFYRELTAIKNAHPDLQLIAVFPQSVDEANRYLRAKDIGIRTVLSRPSEELFVSGTPTLFAVGSDGLIKETWVGYLDDNRKNEALAKVASLLGGKA